MRKVRLDMNVSLDGFGGGPKGELDWIFRTVDDADDAQLRWVTESLREVDTILA
jgi:hypothetical protein